MKKKKRSIQKLNNRGMSLVEIMVAIVIMALVTAPLLQTFVSAARFNANAKEKQRITTAAQSVMEGLKAFSIEEICWQFNNDAAHPFKVYAGVGGVWEIPGAGLAETSIQTIGGVKTYVAPADGKYTFAMQDISFEGKLYDAKIEVSPTASAAASVLNSASLIAGEDMNGYLDAVYKQTASKDSEVYSLVLQNVLDELNDKDQMYEYELVHLDTTKIFLDKDTTININTNAGGISTVTVVLSYSYSAVNYPYYDAAGNELAFTENFADLTYSFEVYNNTDTVSNGALLEDIYCYYYPAYSSSLAGVPVRQETIYINNYTGGTKKVYLIKQKKDIANLNTCENSYTPQVICSGDVELYHNLTTNLADPSGTCGTVTISGSVTPHTELLEENAEILLYDVKITVYGQGAAAGGFVAEPLLVLDGSMNSR